MVEMVAKHKQHLRWEQIDAFLILPSGTKRRNAPGLWVLVATIWPSTPVESWEQPCIGRVRDCRGATAAWMRSRSERTARFEPHNSASAIRVSSCARNWRFLSIVRYLHLSQFRLFDEEPLRGIVHWMIGHNGFGESALVGPQLTGSMLLQATWFTCNWLLENSVFVIQREIVPTLS